MTALPLRPALADVLAALTDTSRETWSFDRRSIVRVESDGANWTPPGAGWHSDSAPWITRDPAEAFEALIARGVLPDAWVGDVRRAFATGITAEERRARGETIDADGSFRAWLPIPALVAWASLSVPAILRAEELARATVAALRPWGAPQPDRVVWRVGMWRPNTDGKRGPTGDPWPMPVGWPTDANDVSDRDLFCESGGGSVETWWAAHAAAWRDPRPCPHASMVTLAETGLWLDAITADAVTVVVPGIGGDRG